LRPEAMTLLLENADFSEKIAENAEGFRRDC
jgi:hypothetical protein